MLVARLTAVLVLVLQAAWLFPISASAQLPTYLSNDKIDIVTQIAKDSIGDDAILVALATTGEVDLMSLGRYPGFSLEDGTSTAWGYQFLTPSGEDGIVIAVIQFSQGNDIMSTVRGNLDSMEVKEVDLTGAYANSDDFAAQLRSDPTMIDYLQDIPDAIPVGVELSRQLDSAHLIPEEFPEDQAIWGIYYGMEMNAPWDSTMICFVASETGETHCVRYETSGVEDVEVAEAVQLSVTPNPIRNVDIAILNIQIPERGQALREVGIYDVVGRKVADLTEEVIPNGDSSLQAELKLEGLSAGTYICRVVQGDCISSVQFVVE